MHYDTSRVHNRSSIYNKYIIFIWCDLLNTEMNTYTKCTRRLVHFHPLLNNAAYHLTVMYWELHYDLYPQTTIKRYWLLNYVSHDVSYNPVRILKHSSRRLLGCASSNVSCVLILHSRERISHSTMDSGYHNTMDCESLFNHAYFLLKYFWTRALN